MRMSSKGVRQIKQIGSPRLFRLEIEQTFWKGDSQPSLGGKGGKANNTVLEC
jgi:hypothetical protein